MKSDAKLEVPQPSPWHFLEEARGLGELPLLAWRFRDLRREPRGEGDPVLVFPGFGASDASTAPLRAYLRYLGYDARGWGIGVNTGDVPSLIPQVTEAAERSAVRTGRPVRLVGWSLGGVLAREVARDAPAAVDRVVTLGLPVVGGAKYTLAGRAYASRGYDLDAIEAEVEERNRIPIRRPVTAIYSRRDRVVAWRACIDRHNDGVEHLEVDTSHVGLGFSADVYRIVARSLAANPDRQSAA
jgi:pimeloyl-ACP methyl ester carboxylesterase